MKQKFVILSSLLSVAVIASVMVFFVIQNQGSKTIEVETIKPDISGMSEEVYKHLTDSADALANNELGISFGNGIQVWKKGTFGKYTKESEILFPVYNRNNEMMGICHYSSDEKDPYLVYANTVEDVDDLKLVMSDSSKVMVISVDKNTMFFAGDKTITKLGSGLVKDDSAYAKAASIYGNEVTDDRYPLGENN